MDLSFLMPVYGFPAPIVSVYINVSRDAEDADHAIDVRWSKARDELAAQGADTQTLSALDTVIGRRRGPPGPCGQIAFAAHGEVTFDMLVSKPPQDYVIGVGPLPHPMPYLKHRGQHVPYVLAVVDSIGADITTVDAGGAHHESQVEGEEHPTHKPREGAEHHKQMQRAVEEQIKHNAERVAREIERFARTSHAEVIVIAGEVQVRGVVYDKLPEGLRGRAVKAEAGSRAAGADNTALHTEVGERLDEHAGEQVRAVVNAYERGRGNEERVTEGLAAVSYALQRGQVDTLLWSVASGGEDREVWIGPRPEQVALTEKELHDIGVAEPVRERADAALIRAATKTGANLVFVPEERTRFYEGIGALLRFADPTLPV
ncbi:baeRF2 domain-containing protein [Salinactinospora qingdaonensis]|uniref:Vms1/Ankzf1 family peptidyl-tRNA hydrolase n=1 Tax=Salinactinospora qingdaonensis TaxID=702744 RepID=A0ABP7G0Q7_9ACTN